MTVAIADCVAYVTLAFMGGLGLGFLIVNYLILKPLLEIVEVFLSNRHESLSDYLKERRRGRK